MEDLPGMPANKAEAEKWAKLAAQQDPSAYNTLLAVNKMGQVQRAEPAQDAFQKGSSLYNSGNMSAAAQMFLAAAQAGNSLAQLQIGWHYETGTGVSRNFGEAAKWYETSAKQGNAKAMNNLGTLYENGNGVPENWVEAARWYTKSAELGDPNGENSLGAAYQFGIGVPQNRRLAIQWYERAASRNPHAALYAKTLKDPTNNIGFRNDGEAQLVIAGRLRYGAALIGGDPAGILFHNSAERMQWLAGLRRRLDFQEATTQWHIADDKYQKCQSAHLSGCLNPGPPPRPQ